MNANVQRNGLFRKSPFERTAYCAITREITNVCSREAATGALTPGEAKRNPGPRPKYHVKPRALAVIETG